MSFESRLKRLEQHYIKSGPYIRGMKLMEQINEAHQMDNRKAIPDLLIKLHRNRKKAS